MGGCRVRERVRGNSETPLSFLPPAPVQSGGRAEKVVSHKRQQDPGGRARRPLSLWPSSIFGLEGLSTNSPAAPGAG